MSSEARQIRVYSRSALRKVRDRAVRSLARRIAIACPWIQESDRSMVRAFAQLEILADEAYARLRVEGLLSAKGEPKALADFLRRCRQTQANLAAQLGLTPRARIEIQMGSRDVPVDGAFERIERVVAQRTNGKETAAAEAEGA